jgi:hypothetical protein
MMQQSSPQLPELSEKPKRKAFTQAQIDLLPFFQLLDENNGNAPEKCQMCMWHIEKGNYLLELGCKHRFHKKCMEMWLVTSNLCPTCKEVCTFTTTIVPDCK